MGSFIRNKVEYFVIKEGIILEKNFILMKNIELGIFVPYDFGGCFYK